MTEVVHRIGAGKNATVFEGRTDVGKRVAIKQLNQLVQQDGSKRERIFAAASAWASMECPRLVSYQDLDETRCWIVMNLMRYSAASRIQQGPAAPALRPSSC